MRLASSVVVLVLAGCAVTNEESTGRAEFDAHVAACQAGVNDPRLDPLRTKIQIGPGQPSLAMLSDSSMASDVHKPAIVALDAFALSCSKGFTDLFSKYGSHEYAAIEHKYAMQAQMARAALYSGAITFGEYNALRQKRTIGYEADRREIARHEDQVRLQRIGAAAAMMQARPQQTYQPMTFTPMQVPQTVNCTSNQVGGTTYTNCR